MLLVLADAGGTGRLGRSCSSMGGAHGRPDGWIRGRIAAPLGGMATWITSTQWEALGGDSWCGLLFLMAALMSAEKLLDVATRASSLASIAFFSK